MTKNGTPFTLVLPYITDIQYFNNWHRSWHKRDRSQKQHNLRQS